MIDFIIATSFLLNPLLAFVFSLNLCILIIRVSKDEYSKVKANIIWICISSVYIIFTLTWMFGNISIASS